MKKSKCNKFIVLFFFMIMEIAFINLIHAQIIRCGVDDPSPEEVRSIREQLNQWISLGKIALTEQITVPIAVHVIRYDDGSGDVSDELIRDQIDTLNSGYAATNFQFTLYSIDRTDSTDWTMHIKGADEEIDMKSDLAVDPSHVLNLYLCANPRKDESHSLLGYSTFPWNYSEGSYMHGVVIKSSTVPWGSEPSYNEGKTATHEIGHYLGLYHTFQNGCVSPGDDVDDTPYEESPAWGCPEGRNTCPQEGNDPIHNYMDYTDDPCMNHFTDGQSSRVDLVVPAYKPSLLNIDVIVEQRRGNGDLMTGSFVDHWEEGDFQPYEVPLPQFTFSNGNQETFRAQQTIAHSPDEKYNVWKRNTSVESDVLNHHSFIIQANDFNFTSQFASTHNATIQAQLIDGGNPSGSIDFKDPWLIDYADPNYGSAMRNRGMNDALWYSKTSPFTPNTNPSGPGSEYKGVFLNQGNPPEWNPPYYSVRAPLTQVYGGATCPFVQWGGDNVVYQNANSQQTGVVFQSANATATALYKGHLLSSVSTATAGNSGRKIAQDITGTEHAIYVSGGSVWYVRSTDLGTSWTSEFGIDKSGYAKNPSIAVNTFHWENGPVYVHVTWEVYNPSDGKNYVKYRRSTDGGTTWQTPIQLSSSPYLTQGFDATPVIATAHASDDFSYATVVWRYGQSGSGGFAVRVLSSANTGTNPAIFSLSGINYPSQLPSLACTNSYGDTKFHLAYTDGSAIYYKWFSFSYVYPQLSIYNESDPITISGTSSNTNPSIAVSSLDDGGFVAVAWDGLNGSNRRVYYRERNTSGVWQPQVEFSHGTYQCSRPSMNFSEKVRLLWQSDTHIAMASRAIGGGSWTPVTDLGTGSGPNLGGLSTALWQPTASWATGSAAPYAINLQTFYGDVSGAISGDEIWSGIVNVVGTVTVNAGSTLTINPGTTIFFNGGSSLVVNGTLNADGIESSRITFDFISRNAGAQNGIRLHGGATSLTYCNIQNAYRGVYCYFYNLAFITIQHCTITNNTFGIYMEDMYSQSIPISYNTIASNTADGIYLNGVNGPMNINNNTISYNGMYGIHISCYDYSAPYIYNNIIESHSYDGVRCEYYSSLNLLAPSGSAGHNVIRDNGYSISAYYSSSIYATNGQNSIYNGEFWDARAVSSSHIYAVNNWWGGGAPCVYIAGGSTIDYIPYLSSNPNGSMGKIAMTGTSEPRKNLHVATDANSQQGSAGQFLDSELSAALQSMLEGKYEDAIIQYVQRFKKEKDVKKNNPAAYTPMVQKYVLNQLARCYKAVNGGMSQGDSSSGAVGGKNFIDFLNKEVRPGLSQDNELYAATLELENLFLMKERNYKKVIDNFTALKIRFAKNEAIHKYALFNLGSLYFHQLTEGAGTGNAKWREYFDELETKYPDDELTWHTKLLLGEIDSIPAAARMAWKLGKEAAVAAVPGQFALLDNYPNPFNPTTTIKYQLPDVGTRFIVSLKVYDVLGREAATLVDEMKEAGYYTATFDGSRFASGIYFMRFIAQPQGGKPFVQVKKMLMMK